MTATRALITSAEVTIPTSISPDTTGRLSIFRSYISCAACTTVSSGAAVITFLVMTSSSRVLFRTSTRCGSPKGGLALLMSRSETIPTSRSSSTIGMCLIRRSRQRRRPSNALASGPSVRTPCFIQSRISSTTVADLLRFSYVLLVTASYNKAPRFYAIGNKTEEGGGSQENHHPLPASLSPAQAGNVGPSSEPATCSPVGSKPRYSAASSGLANTITLSSSRTIRP